MNFQFDLSLNTLVVSGVIALVGLGLRAVAWALIEAGKALINKLVETIAKVEILTKQMDELTRAVGDVQKMRTDVNAYYERLKQLEVTFKNRN